MNIFILFENFINKFLIKQIINNILLWYMDIKPIGISERDLSLEQINNQLTAKEQFLRNKKVELLKKGKDNEYLKPVNEEYNFYSKEKEKEKEKIIIAMKKVIQHLDEVTNDSNSKLTKEDLIEIGKEKKEIEKIINCLLTK